MGGRRTAALVDRRGSCPQRAPLTSAGFCRTMVDGGIFKSMVTGVRHAYRGHEPARPQLRPASRRAHVSPRPRTPTAPGPVDGAGGRALLPRSEARLPRQPGANRPAARHPHRHHRRAGGRARARAAAVARDLPHRQELHALGRARSPARAHLAGAAAAGVGLHNPVAPAARAARAAPPNRRRAGALRGYQRAEGGRGRAASARRCACSSSSPFRSPSSCW